MKNLLSKNILLIGRRWSTRGLNNDFEHFLKFFPGSNHVTNKELKNFDNYIYRFAKRNTGNRSYSSLSVALEHKALATLIKKTSSLYIIGLETTIIITDIGLKEFLELS